MFNANWVLGYIDPKLYSLGGWIIGYIISGFFFGFITKYIAKSKGYSGGFSWRFWLGIIGLLIVGFRPNIDTNHPASNELKKVETEETITTYGLDVLTQLAKLHEQGILSDEEFQKKKEQILSKI